MLRRLLAGALLVLGLPAPLTVEARERQWFATLHAGQWLSSNLADVPTSGGTGDLELKSGYFVSGLVNRVLVGSLNLGWPVLGPVLEGSSIEVEGQFGQHFGLQHHQEATLSLVLRSRQIELPWTAAQVNLAVSEGLSYALSRPAYEGTEKGETPHKFLNYLAFEAEFSHPSWPGISIVPRLHHRSGIFGFIAPQGAGSNFVGVGLRFRLQ